MASNMASIDDDSPVTTIVSERSSSHASAELNVTEVGATSSGSVPVGHVPASKNAEDKGTGGSALLLCIWKHCKRVTNGGRDAKIMRRCDNGSCIKLIHSVCLENMLSSIAAPSDFNKIVCGKRCFNAVLKQQLAASTIQDEASTTSKKRVFWHNDGPTQDVSSLSILVDWMTSGDNYCRYRGGEAQTGEKKLVIAQEVVRLCVQAGITTARTAKDVMSKITHLQTTFYSASDWLHATGQGVTNERDIRSAIISRCPQYYELVDVMNDRPNARPPLLNTDADAAKSDTEDETDQASTSSVPSSTSEGEPSTPPDRSTSRPLSIGPPPQKKPRKGDFEPHKLLSDVKQAQMEQVRELKIMELEVQEKKLRMQQEELQARKQQLAHESLVSLARVEESKAHTAKLLEETEHERVKRKVALLLGRNQLLQAGVSLEDVDLLLPLLT